MIDSTEILSLPPPPADRRIAYGKGEFHFGDLRLPQGASKHPVVVVIHGGYWRAQYGLEHIGHLCKAVSELGCATWNLEYRRIGHEGGGYPGTILDVAGGLNHLRVLADEYALDLDRLVLIGHSAGGHLACWLAGARRIPVTSPLHLADLLNVRAVVSLAGVLDLKRGFELGLSRRVIDSFIGGSPEQFPERYADGSPFELLPMNVRQILLHGTEDVNVPYEISQRYYDKARALGDDVRLVTLAGMGHFEIIDPRSTAWKFVSDAVQEAWGETKVLTSH